MSCHKVILQLAEKMSEAHTKRRVSLLQQVRTEKSDPIITSQIFFLHFGSFPICCILVKIASIKIRPVSWQHSGLNSISVSLAGMN